MLLKHFIYIVYSQKNPTKNTKNVNKKHANILHHFLKRCLGLFNRNYEKKQKPIENLF